MKKIIAAFVAVVGMTIVSAPPAEANPISDAASSTWSTSKDVASGTVHVLGGVIEPMVDFIVKSTHSVVMTAVDHPVQAGIGLALVVATVAAPPLLSVDGEVLATAATVETAGSVELVDAAATVEVESVGSAETIADVGTESETAEVSGASRTAGFEESDVTEETCEVELEKCGKPVPPEERATRAVSSSDRKKTLEDAGCYSLRTKLGLPGCKSALSGKRFHVKDVAVDHKVPLACGGNNSLANLQVLSVAENLAKGGTCLV